MTIFSLDEQERQGQFEEEVQKLVDSFIDEIKAGTSENKIAIIKQVYATIKELLNDKHLMLIVLGYTKTYELSVKHLAIDVLFSEVCERLMKVKEFRLLGVES